jgi:hypothetical protein
MTLRHLRLPTPGFSLFCAADRAQSVGCGDASDGTGGETSLKNLAVRIEGEIGRVNNAATRFPAGADFVGIFGDLQAVADGKGGAGALDHFFGFVQWIDRKSNDLGVLLFEFVDMRLIVGNLPDAVGSPNAAVKDDHGVLGFDVGGNIQNAASDGWHRIVRKHVSGA